MPRIHEIKCLTEYFEATAEGLKGFEIRMNDRDYQVGDLLAMNEYDGQKYTGRSMLLKVDYMMDPNDVMTCGQGYVVMGVYPIMIPEKVDRLWPNYILGGKVKKDEPVIKAYN